MAVGSRFKSWVGGEPDWRGWITLVWVLWWAWAYGIMAIKARYRRACQGGCDCGQRAIEVVTRSALWLSGLLELKRIDHGPSSCGRGSLIGLSRYRFRWSGKSNTALAHFDVVA